MIPAAAGNVIIRLEDLALSFDKQGNDLGRPIFQHLNLEIEEGEFICVLGPSGTGKSTLLRVVAGLLPPSEGKVHLLPRADGKERRIGFAFQDARLLPWRRTIDNAAFGLEALNLSKQERRTRAAAALVQVGLAGLEQRWPHQLSGGQRQRVALARALAIEPDLLLMDEPFAALDAITRREMQDELVRLWQASRATVLFVTHDVEEARYLADRIVVLEGSPARLAAVRRVNASRKERAARRAAEQTLHLSESIEEWTI
ncbi:MAG: transporter [Rhodospirillales bacterium]|nr:transporter [Rhodospirillales bacterium]